MYHIRQDKYFRTTSPVIDKETQIRILGEIREIKEKIRELGEYNGNFPSCYNQFLEEMPKLYKRLPRIRRKILKRYLKRFNSLMDRAIEGNLRLAINFQYIYAPLESSRDGLAFQSASLYGLANAIYKCESGRLSTIANWCIRSLVDRTKRSEARYKRTATYSTDSRNEEGRIAHEIVSRDGKEKEAVLDKIEILFNCPRLNTNDRELLRKLYISGEHTPITLEELAEELRTTLGAVRARKDRALNKVRAWVKYKGIN